MTSALPSQLVYSPVGKPPAVPQNSYRVNSYPENGSRFKMGEVIKLSLNGGARYGSYLIPHDTALKFEIKNGNNANGIYLDGQADCIFQKISIWHGSAMLEELNSAGHLASVLRKAMWDSNMPTSVAELTTGNGDEIAQNKTETFIVPLCSGVLGSLAERYLPLGAMNGGDLRIEIQLADFNTGLWDGEQGTAAGASDITIENVVLLTSMLDLPPEVQMNIDQALGGVYNIPTSMYQEAQTTTTAGAVKDLLQLPFRVSSCKGILTTFRNSNSVSDITKRSISGTFNPLNDDGEYQWRLGNNTLVPMVPIKGSKEAFYESVQKGFNLWNHTRASSDINKDHWYYFYDQAYYEGDFFLFVNTEHHPGAQAQMESGTNLLNGNSYLSISYGKKNATATTPGLGASTLVTSFVSYDSIVRVENGVANVAF